MNYVEKKGSRYKIICKYECGIDINILFDLLDLDELLISCKYKHILKIRKYNHSDFIDQYIKKILQTNNNYLDLLVEYNDKIWIIKIYEKNVIKIIGVNNIEIGQKLIDKIIEKISIDASCNIIIGQIEINLLSMSLKIIGGVDNDKFVKIGDHFIEDGKLLRISPSLVAIKTKLGNFYIFINGNILFGSFSSKIITEDDVI